MSNGIGTIDYTDKRESGCPIRSNANRSQTYDTDRNLSKQTAYLHFHEQHHAADARVERKQKKKHVVCRSLENQRIVTGIIPSVNTCVKIARFARIAVSHTSFQLTRAVSFIKTHIFRML